MHDERKNKHSNEDVIPAGAVPTYLLDREGVSRAKVLSNTIKQKRKEKAGKWEVPLPKVKPISDDEMFKVLRTGVRKSTCCGWPTLSFGYVLFCCGPWHADGLLLCCWCRRKVLEAYGDQGDVCGGRLHAKATEIRAVHSAHGFASQESPRHTSRVADDVLLGHSGREEEPAVTAVHTAWRVDQGHHHRGECVGIEHGDHLWQGCVGKVRASHQQPGAASLYSLMFQEFLGHGYVSWCFGGVCRIWMVASMQCCLYNPRVNGFPVFNNKTKQDALFPGERVTWNSILTA
jgi:hypothetical protein